MGDGNNAGRVSLKKCPSYTKAVEKSEGYYLVRGDGENLGIRPFEKYRDLGVFGDYHIVEYEWNGGGTGVFSGLISTRVERDELILGPMHLAGDRCNFGLDRVRREGSKLVAEFDITPENFLSLADSGWKSNEVESGKCLVVGHAHGCFEAVAIFEFDNSTREKFKGVLLGSEPLPADSKETCVYESCFEFLCNERIKSGKRLLGPSEMKVFSETWRKTCVGAH
jgi:hypothetical protein